MASMVQGVRGFRDSTAVSTDHSEELVSVLAVQIKVAGKSSFCVF